MRSRQITTFLVAAAAATVLAIAPSAAAQVAISGTFYGPHGGVHINSGVPYAYGGSRYCPTGSGYGYAPYSSYGYAGYVDDGYCAPSYGYSYYAPAPVYVPRYRHYRPAYPYRAYSYRSYGHGSYGRGSYGQGDRHGRYDRHDGYRR